MLENEIIQEFINQCRECVNIRKKLPRKKVSFDFLYSDTDIRKNIVNVHEREVYIKYKCAEISVNKIDKLLMSMIVRVYPKAPFFKIYYNYQLVLMNRERCGIIFDELELYGTSTDDIFHMFGKDKKYIISVLKAHGYEQLAKQSFDMRIPLVDIMLHSSSEYILGTQPYLESLLTSGVEYENRYRKKISKDIDNSLCVIAEELINLVKYSKYTNGECLVADNVPHLTHAEAIDILNSLCLEYGGRRLSDKGNTHVWKIGEEELCEGDIVILSSVYVYVSSYIKTFYAQVHQSIYVKGKGLELFKIQTNIFGEDAAILLGMTTNMFYNAVERLEKIGYYRQKELNYKLPVKRLDNTITHDLEIGEILFGLKPHEYSYIDEVKII